MAEAGSECFCLIEREVNWGEAVAPLCLCSGQTCQKGTYEIKSPKNEPTGSAKADTSACVQLKYHATRHFPDQWLQTWEVGGEQS